MEPKEEVRGREKGTAVAPRKPGVVEKSQQEAKCCRGAAVRQQQGDGTDSGAPRRASVKLGQTPSVIFGRSSGY